MDGGTSNYLTTDGPLGWGKMKGGTLMEEGGIFYMVSPPVRRSLEQVKQ